MIVCLCHRVSDRDIADEARAGCASFDALQDRLRVGTGCGACIDYAQSTFAQHAASALPCPRACSRTGRAGAGTGGVARTQGSSPPPALARPTPLWLAPAAT